MEKQISMRFLLIITASLVLATSEAKRLRGGTAAWRPTHNYDDQNPEIAVVFRVGFQLNFFNDQNKSEVLKWRCTRGCSANVPSEFIPIENCSRANWLWGGNQFTLKLHKQAQDFALIHKYTATPGLEGSMIYRSMVFRSIEVSGKTGIRSDTERANSSPVSNMLPLVTLENTNTSIDIPVGDIDGDKVKCFFQKGIPQMESIFSIDKENCKLKYVQRDIPLEEYVGVYLIIQDYPRTKINLHGFEHGIHKPLSEIPLQFFVHFVYNVTTPTDQDGFMPQNNLPAHYKAKVNSKLLIGPIPIQFRKGKPHLIVVGASGLVQFVRRPKVEISKTGGKVFEVYVKWKPKSHQIGSYVLCMTFADRRTYLYGNHSIICTTVFVTDPCYPNRCRQGGHCTVMKRRFKCDCGVGFTGKKCEIETIECERGTCWNSGWCDSQANPSRCVCVTGFQGKHCYDDVDECEAGACAENAICKNGFGTYSCTCKPGYKGDPYKYCTGFCANEIHFSDNGTFSFPSIFAKLTALSLEVCHDSNRSIASMRCAKGTDENGNVVFRFDPKSFHHLACDVTLEAVDLELKSNATSTAAVSNAVKNLEILTAGGANNSNEEKAAEMLKTISNLDVTTDVEILTNFVSAASNIMEHIPDTRQEAQPESSDLMDVSSIDQATWLQRNSIINSVMSLGKKAHLPLKESNVLVDTARIAVEIKQLGSDDGDLVEEMLDLENETWRDVVTLSPRIYTDAKLGVQSNPVALAIPKSIYQQQATCKASTEKCKGDFATSGVRASLVVHKSTPGGKNGNSMGDSLNQIVAVELSSIDTSSLTEPIALSYRANKNENTSVEDLPNFRCVFWDETALEWSGRGCTLRSSNENATICECNHMTTFALLVSVSEPNVDNILDIVTQVGCILSSVCLVLTIVIHLAISQLRNRRPTPIMVNLCANLLISYLLFNFGVERFESKILCHIVAGVLHWSLLSAWCWMAVYNYSMYLAFVKVLNYVRKHFWLMVSMFAYGIPTIIVGTSVGYFVVYIDGNAVNGTESVYHLPELCWLRDDALYYTFLAPIGVLLLYNLVVYFLVIRKLTWKRTQIQSTVKKSSTSHELAMGISLAACLGLPWVFGYFMLVSTDYYFHMIMSWLFTGFNAFQGLSIFIISCVRQQHVRKLWVRYLVRSRIYKSITRNKNGKSSDQQHSKASPTQFSRITPSDRTIRRNFH